MFNLKQLCYAFSHCMLALFAGRQLSAMDASWQVIESQGVQQAREWIAEHQPSDYGLRDRTMFHLAARYGFLDVFERLGRTRQGADLINVRDEYGCTPLHLAVRFGQLHIVAWLLSHGAQLNDKQDKPIVDKDGYSALHEAVECIDNDEEGVIVETLTRAALQRSWGKAKDALPCELARLEAAKKMRAARRMCYVDIVTLLLKSGASTNSKDKNGIAPLYIAAYHGSTDVVELLLAYGANPNIQNVSRETPLHAAVRFAQINVIRLLRAYGADSEIRDCLKCSPLKAAQDYSVLPSCYLSRASNVDIRPRQEAFGEVIRVLQEAVQRIPEQPLPIVENHFQVPQPAPEQAMAAQAGPSNTAPAILTMQPGVPTASSLRPEDTRALPRPRSYLEALCGAAATFVGAAGSAGDTVVVAPLQSEQVQPAQLGGDYGPIRKKKRKHGARSRRS